MAKKIEHSEPQDVESQALTAERERFCQLYVCGGVSFAGQLAKCFKEVFGEDYRDVSIDARRLVREPLVMARIRELSAAMTSEVESIAVKMQITETLRSIMEETASDNFTDRFGSHLSPAPLRAVAVNAAKALMELYPIKHVHETKLKIEGSEGGVVFNVIVPDTKQNDDAGPEE
ncbi:MAG: hypothetical protein LBU98_06465 [Alistipes sp.]|jgi:hypothetical protein|nr:hypothetical protein [Alistipes sp.]